jgi:hypothetical protein
MYFMKSLSLLLGTLALAAAAPSVPAQLVSTSAEFGAFYTDDASGLRVGVNLEAAAGPMYFLLASFDDFQSLPVLLGPYPLAADGSALFLSDVDASVAALLPELLKVGFRPLFVDGSYVNTTQAASIVLNDDGCEELDFDFAAGGAPFLAGEVVTEQWAGIGLHISGESQLPGQPNKVIVFDSSNPTGGDTDLQTPGYGPNNDTALGKLLIIAENDIDADNDTYIDDPDDAFNGGLMHFNFDEPQLMCSATFVDVDDVDPGQGITRLRFYGDNAGTIFLGSILCPTAPDNNVTRLFFHVEGVRRLDVKMGGSGALGVISYCPVCIDFDETSKGIPLDMPAGTIVTNQFADLGFNVSATNKLGGPRKAVIFDSANPTGGDSDLATPGYHPTNTVAEGKIIVIAENEVDADFDGLIDDPDDEATGGNVFFDFDFDVHVEELTFIDVDGLEASWVQGIDSNNNIVGTIPLANLGDNSRQTISIDLDNVRRFKVHFGGSGSVAGFCFCADSPNDNQ